MHIITSLFYYFVLVWVVVYDVDQCVETKITVNGGGDMQIGDDRRSGPTWAHSTVLSYHQASFPVARPRQEGGLTAKNLEQHDPMKPTHLHNSRCLGTLFMEPSDKNSSKTKRIRFQNREVLVRLHPRGQGAFLRPW